MPGCPKPPKPGWNVSCRGRDARRPDAACTPSSHAHPHSSRLIHTHPAVLWWSPSASDYDYKTLVTALSWRVAGIHRQPARSGAVGGNLSHSRVQRVDKTTAIAVRSPDSEGFAESPSTTVVGGGRGSVAFSCTANGIAGASATSALSDLRASARAAVFSTCQGARDLGGARQSHTPRPTRRAVRYASLEYQRYTVCLRTVVPTLFADSGGGTPVAC